MAFKTERELYSFAEQLIQFRVMYRHLINSTRSQGMLFLCLSLFNLPFSTWTYVSHCLLKQRIMEVVVTVKSSPPTPNFLQVGWCPSCCPTNSVKSKHWREVYHIPWTCLPQAYLGSSNFVFDHSLIYHMCLKCLPLSHMHVLSDAYHWSMDATIVHSVLC